MKYSHFVAVPMSSISENEREDFRRFLTVACIRLKQISGKPVFCAALHNGSTHDFDDPATAYDVDMEAVEQSEQLIMIYPSSINSSVIAEAIMATALKKPVTMFVRRREDLPFIMCNMDKAKKTAGRVQIIEYRSEDDITEHLGLNRD